MHEWHSDSYKDRVVVRNLLLDAAPCHRTPITYNTNKCVETNQK